MDLALELRNQIWSNALPEKIDSALYLYKKGCWHPLYLKPSDPHEEYDHKNDNYNLCFEFRHDLLDQIQVHTLLVFVNHDVREIAIAWAHKQGFFINENKGYPVFGRPFNPENDMLYIKPGDVYEFWTEPFSIPNEHPDLIGQQYSIRSFVEKIAISEDTWQEELKAEPEDQFMDELTLTFPFKMLIVITATPSELRSANGNLEMRQHWELDSTRGGEFVLDAHDGTFQFHGSEYANKEDLYKSL
ncbi:hypothetical protein EYC80_002177 [Monilinia laxa]|uniref:Uncharacterized protein n=1 Tax=Monilinia laxa TaxID=61186 RepID=A0A5N6K346_MONLA|nr:hypothetical protein EYC80_002177 [Monilinia laxa]